MNEQSTELEKAIESLNRSERRFAKLFLDHPAPMVITTIKEGRIINANARIADLLGYRRDEMIGRTSDELGIWVDPNERAQLMEQLNLEGAVQNRVTKIRCRSGKLRDTMLSVEFIEIEGETGPSAIWMATDITELKHTEELLKMREQEISAIADNIPGLIDYIDSEGRILYANKLHEEWFGVSRSEIVGKHYSQAYPATASDRVKNAMELLRAGKSVQYEAAHPWARPTPRWVLANYVPDLDDQGKLKGFFLFGIDITERKQAEDALRAREEKFRAMIEHGSEAIALTDAQGMRLFESPAAKRILGYSDQEILGQFVLKFVHPDEVEHLRELWVRLVSEPGAIRTVECRLRHKNGAWRWVEAAATNMLNIPAVHAIVVNYHDTTERKQAEEQIHRYAARLQTLSDQLMTAQEAERRTIARELHDEIGQVLTAVSTGLQGIQHARNRTTRSKRLNETIALVDQTWNRIRALALDLRPSMLDDFGLVPALDWYLKQQAGRSGFKSSFAVELPPLRFEPNLEITVFRIAQIALTNVARHARAKHVAVELRLRAAQLEIVIRDDGVGFDVPSALDRAAHGESMGLLSLQERVRLAGGQLEIKSSPGQGTEIRARFPIPGKEVITDESKLAR